MAITAPTLTPQQIGDHLRAALEGDVLDVTDTHGTARVTVRAEALPRAARLCKSEPRLAFDFFDFLSAVDEREQGFAVIVSLYSLSHRHHVTLRALAEGGRDAPRVPSLTGIYRGANWHERETYDMFGITFDGHPSLLPRILTVENFEGWPLRKEFLLATREAKPWPGAKEPEEHREEAGPGQSAAVIANAEPLSAAQKDAAAEAKAGAAQARADAPAGETAEVDYDRALYEQLIAEGKSDRIARSRAKAAAMRARKKSAEAADADAPAADPSAVPAGSQAEGAAAAAERSAAGDPGPSSPEGAAAVAELDMADPSIAYDAAAGAVGGDVAAGAPGDVAGVDQPVSDLAAEARVGTGAPPTASGTPGIEAEGRHSGAAEQSGERPAADTPGMGTAPGGAVTPPSDQPAEGGSSALGEGQVTRPAPGSEEATLFDDLPADAQARPGGAAEAGEVSETPLVHDDAAEPAPAPGTDASDREGPLYGATGSAHEDDEDEEGTTP